MSVIDTGGTIFAKRISEMVDRGHAQASQLVERLQADTIADSIGRVGPGRADQRVSVAVTDRGDMALGVGERRERLHPHAAVQLAERLDLPGAWARDWSLAGQPWQRIAMADLLAASLTNTTKRERVLLRSVAGQVRAVMSDSYRRLDSPAILRAFGDAASGVGAVPVAASVSDLRWSVDWMIPRPLGLDLGPHGQEWVAAGMTIANSDFGAAALSIRFRILRLVCLNGAVAASAMREVHLGGRLPDDIAMSEETYRLDTRATASAVGDLVRGLLSTEGVRRRFVEAQAAASTTEAPEVIEGMVKARRLSANEAKSLGETFARSDIAQIPAGPLTRWKLAQGISWLAHSAQGERASELEALAGSLVFAAK